MRINNNIEREAEKVSRNYPSDDSDEYECCEDEDYSDEEFE